MVSEAAVESGWGSGPPDDLCLSFANTRFWRGTAHPTEELQAPADLLRWCASAAGLDAGTLDRIGVRWAAEPAVGSAALTRAIALREAVYRLFAERVPGAADIAAINNWLASAAPRASLAHAAGTWRWALSARTGDLDVLLAPVLWSAGDLLTGRRLAKVRCCANERCRFLFLDDSKAGTRRWCAMSACGNRAKAHRHYAKLRAARET
jgi:predicted RNA-binding Zn ribbon-like protein